jgi:hypothetical protein
MTERTEGTAGQDHFHTPEDLARTAAELLQKLPDEEADQFLNDVFAQFLGRFRGLLREAILAPKLNRAMVEIIGLETEWSQVAARLIGASLVNPGGAEGGPTGVFALRQCLRDCEAQYSRCLATTDPNDRLGRYICNLQATGCAFGCTLSAFGRPPTTA